MWWEETPLQSNHVWQWTANSKTIYWNNISKKNKFFRTGYRWKIGPAFSVTTTIKSRAFRQTAIKSTAVYEYFNISLSELGNCIPSTLRAIQWKQIYCSVSVISEALHWTATCTKLMTNNSRLETGFRDSGKQNTTYFKALRRSVRSGC